MFDGGESLLSLRGRADGQTPTLTKGIRYNLDKKAKLHVISLRLSVERVQQKLFINLTDQFATTFVSRREREVEKKRETSVSSLLLSPK